MDDGEAEQGVAGVQRAGIGHGDEAGDAVESQGGSNAEAQQKR